MGLVWICIPILFQRLCPSYHLTGATPPLKSVQNSKTVQTAIWMVDITMYGYIGVCNGIYGYKNVNKRKIENVSTFALLHFSNFPPYQFSTFTIYIFPIFHLSTFAYPYSPLYTQIYPYKVVSTTNIALRIELEFCTLLRGGYQNTLFFLLDTI